MRSARGDVRGHIILHKNDHGPSYRAKRALQRQGSLKINFREIFRRRSIFDFCNTIGTKRTCWGHLTMSALEGRTDLPFKPGHFRF